MNQRLEIAKRLRALREDAGLTSAQIADEAGISEAEYASCEQGTVDIPVGWLTVFSRRLGVSTTGLLTGSDPHAQVYHLTRKGTGPVIERRNEYHYEGLAVQFGERIMDPFVVTVAPRAGDTISLNTHPGDEFDFVLSGKLGIRIDGHDLVLEEGDSVYFDASKEHGMLALDGKPASFLAIVCESGSEAK